MIQPAAADETGLRRAVEVLDRHGVVGCPTETVYGLAVNPLSETALEALFTVKSRDRGRPVLLVVDGPEQLAPLVGGISDAAGACIRQFWPGPLSLLFQASPGLPDAVTAGSGRVCIRQTSHPVAAALCRAWGGGLTSTSANLTGEPPALTAGDACLKGVGLVLDGGTLAPSEPSTVFDPDTRTVLREGKITPEMLRRAGVL